MMDDHVKAFVSTRTAEMKIPPPSPYEDLYQRWTAVSIGGENKIKSSVADEHVMRWRERRMDEIRGGKRMPVRLKTIDDIRGRNRAIVELENIGFLKAKMMDSRGILR